MSLQPQPRGMIAMGHAGPVGTPPRRSGAEARQKGRDVDTVTLVLAGVFSLIGMAAFAYGRRAARIGVALGGVILMFVPYVVPDPLAMLVIGGAIIAGMYLFPG